jgi:hypothetical protein
MLNKSVWLKIIIISVIVLVVVIIAGLSVKKWLPNMLTCAPGSSNLSNPSDSSSQSFLDEFNRKFQEKADAGALPPMTMGSILSVNYLWGRIIKIDYNSLILRIANRYQGGGFADYVLNQPNSYEIKIVIDEKTQITQVIPLKPEEMAIGKVSQEKKIALSDLREEATIEVELLEVVDITKIQEVVAAKIKLALPLPVAQ